jgi:hypothetical protein
VLFIVSYHMIAILTHLSIYIFHLSSLFLHIIQGYDLYMHFDRVLAKKLIKVMHVVPVTYRSIHTFTGSVVSMTLRKLTNSDGFIIV